MAYLETVTNRILLNLRNAGLTVYEEFELRTKPVPSDALFLTVNISGLNTQTPLPYQDGTAVPLTLILRIRLHCKPQDHSNLLTACWQSAVLPTLLDAGYAISDIRLKETAYRKEIDRMVKEAVVTVSALITRTPLE